jgi:nitrite reductase (NADH) large subunit
MSVDAARLFANYTQTPSVLPSTAWMALRALTLAATLGLAGLLLVSPMGVKFFWGLVVPLLPALFVVAPGLWRQVCPMAFVNQLPILIGRSSSRRLPHIAQDWAFTIAVGAFIALIGLRQPLLNNHGAVVGAGILVVLVLAFAGGVAFKGRSGWCGTFCPLAPVQRAYGHAPLVLIGNGYCRTCVGCQKNCYDFNPRAAIFEDLLDTDPAYAGQRRFFMAMMPGLVLGYYLQPAHVAYGEGVRTLILLGAICLSVGLYHAAISFFRANPFGAANLFAGLGLGAYYWFAGPVILSTAQTISGVRIPEVMVFASQWVGILLAVALAYRGWQSESVFRRAQEAAAQPRVAASVRNLKERLKASTKALVTDAETGASFPVAPNQTLLEALETARMRIEFGCRSGLCGADAVIVQSGQENLSPPDPTEQATLRRLGLDGVGRLACMCHVQGNVVIDRDVKNAKRSFSGAVASVADPLKERGIGRVVIVGNGVAGITVAEYLRRESKSAQITIVTDEVHHFYNRMAVGRLISGRSAMDGMMLLPQDWYAEHEVDVWRNTLAVSIDRSARSLRLGTGEAVSYDVLVLATGADPILPASDYARFSNAFVLRRAEDALAVRMWAQREAAKRAVVIGGGVLGIEAADVLRTVGLRVKVLHRASRLMERQLDEQGSLRLQEYLVKGGVDVQTEAAVAHLAGKQLLEGVVLENGTRVSGDIFLACIGVRPRTKLAQSCGLEVGQGIKVDRSMRTSDPAIYAVGDVAELPGAAGGLWSIAAGHAVACAAGIMGRSDGYEVPRLVVHLKCDGIDLKSYGDMEVRGADEVSSATGDAIAWWRIVLRDGALVSMVFVGPPGSGHGFEQWVQPGADVRAVVRELRGTLTRQEVRAAERDGVRGT